MVRQAQQAARTWLVQHAWKAFASLLVAFAGLAWLGAGAKADSHIRDVARPVAAQEARQVFDSAIVPIVAHQKRSDTTLTLIRFQMDELLTAEQKRSAEENMRKALRNLNHGR